MITQASPQTPAATIENFVILYALLSRQARIFFFLLKTASYIP
jgi:hypothetical protein